MAMVRILLALLLALGAGFASAEEASPPVPDPRNLGADWWSYFVTESPLDADKFQQRVTAAQTSLAAYRDTLRSEGDAEQARVAERLLVDLARFQQLRTAPAPVSRPASPVAASYTLEEALQRHAAWRDLNQQIDAEREESDWQSVIIAEQRQQQSRRRNNYLELEDTDPQRAQTGLGLMLSRFAVELKRLDLDRRRLVLSQAEERLLRLRAELDAIPELLVSSPRDAARWQQEQERAERVIARLREQIDQSTLSDPKLVDSGQGLSETQHSVLVAVSQDIEIRLNQLVAMQARLARNLIPIISDVVDKDTDTEAARRLLAEHRELQEQVRQQRDRWRRIAERGRSIAAAAAPEGGDTTAVKLRNTILTRLKQVDGALLKLDQQVPSTGFVADLLKARQNATENWFDRNLTDLKDMSGNSWSMTIDLLGATLFEVNEAPVTTLDLLRLALILTAALWLSKGIRRAISRVGERRGGVSQNSLYVFGRLVHYAVLTIGIVVGLSSIGIDFTKFALFASALGIGIGFGLQTLIGNFVAGLIILFEKSLKVGDFVELESGVTGQVNEINMRSTLITTNDNIDILVPNSEFVGGRVINWTLREAYRRTKIPFGVAYGTDKELVQQAALEAADKVPWTLRNARGREPQVWFVEFGDSSLNFELIVWLTPEAVKRPGAVHAAYLWEIESKLNEHGIEVPFPQRDLHLRSMFGRKDDDGAAFLSKTSAGD